MQICNAALTLTEQQGLHRHHKTVFTVSAAQRFWLRLTTMIKHYGVTNEMQLSPSCNPSETSTECIARAANAWPLG